MSVVQLDEERTSSGGFYDSLLNLLIGLGGDKDKIRQSEFTLNYLSPVQLDKAYRADWLSRKIVDIPAFDCTREWRHWQAEQEQIETLEETERNFRIQRKMMYALIRARLYGGGALIIGVDQGNMDEELDIEKVGKGDLKWIHAVSRYQLMAGPLVRDVTNPYFGEPEWYDRINMPTLGAMSSEPNALKNSIQMRLHPSRVVRLLGNEYPNMEQSPDSWSDSVLQTVDDAIKQAGLVPASMAHIVGEMKMDVIKVPGLTGALATKKGTEKYLARFGNSNAYKSVINALLIDKEEEWQRIESHFEGMPQLIQAFLFIAAGAADIPATRLLGREPAGQNATGEGDLRNYYDRLSAEQQNEYGPALTRLDEVLIRHTFGERDPDIHYEWAPLWQQSDDEKATVALKKAQTHKIDVDNGLINPDALRDARVNQLIEDGTFPGLEAAIDEYGAEPDEEDQMMQQGLLGGGPGGGPGGPGGPDGGPGGGSGGAPNGAGGAQPRLAKPQPVQKDEQRAESARPFADRSGLHYGDARNADFDPDQPRGEHGRWEAVNAGAAVEIEEQYGTGTLRARTTGGRQLVEIHEQKRETKREFFNPNAGVGPTGGAPRMKEVVTQKAGYHVKHSRGSTFTPHYEQAVQIAVHHAKRAPVKDYIADTSATGVIFHTPQGKVLFTKRRDSGEWSIPAGHIESSENSYNAARREAAEETGYTGGFDLEEVDRRTVNGVDFTSYAQAVPDEFEPWLNHEHVDHRWAYVDNPPNPLHPGLRATIKFALGDALLDFDPDEPRDDHGRWTAGSSEAGEGPEWVSMSTGSVIPTAYRGEKMRRAHMKLPEDIDIVSAYHGTTKEVLDNIKKNGLVPHGSFGADVWARGHGASVDYPAYHFKAGERNHSVYLTADFGHALAFAKIASEVRKQTPALLRVEIPAEEVHKHMRGDEAGSFGMVRFEGTIKPEWISPVDVDPELYQGWGMGVTSQKTGKMLAQTGDAANAATIYAIVFDSLPEEIAELVQGTEVKDYDPDEPRNEKGEWTTGGGEAGATESETPLSGTEKLGREQTHRSRKVVAPLSVETVRSVINDISAKIGFNTEKVSVRGGVPPSANVSGFSGVSMGQFSGKTGGITLYARALSTKKDVVETFVHETMHAKEHAVLHSHKPEVKKIIAPYMTDAAIQSRIDHPNVTSQYSSAHWGHFELIKSLGATPTELRSDFKVVQSETLAEMAIGHHRHNWVVGNRNWAGLYHAINRAYRVIQND